MAMSREVLLSLHAIRKTFPGLTALDDVDFDLRRGEVHILLGENGAGKSTLVKILSGAYQPTSGIIRLEGGEIRIYNPRQAQESGIATIYQEFNLIPHLTAGENIFLGREPMLKRGVIDNKRLHASAQEILDGLGVAIDAFSPVHRLSVAGQQMVEIARALSMDARILIMDEPTSALTEKEIAELFATIRRLRDQSVSMVYISHRLEELFTVGDRVTVLRDGKVVGTRDIASMTKNVLIRMMAGRDVEEHYPRRRINPGASALRVSGLIRRGAFRDVSFDLRRGEIVGIAGLLGSGRTELVRVIFGADAYHRGTVEIHGRIVQIKSPHRAIRYGLGLLPEDRKNDGLILNLSVRDNICLASVDRLSRWGAMKKDEEQNIARRFVDTLNIKTTGLEQKALSLSGGNQQKVVIAKWLCTQSDILIFDEPTRGIDVASKVEIYEWMNRLTSEGAAILMVSSDLPEILGMSDRILVMHEGAIAGEFLSGEASQEAILECALGV